MGDDPIEFDRHGHHVAIVQTPNTVQVYDLRGNAVSRPILLQGKWTSMEFNPDGQLLATLTDDQIIELWRIDGSKLVTLTRHEATEIMFFEYRPDSLFTWDRELRIARIWNTNGGLIGMPIGPFGKMSDPQLMYFYSDSEIRGSILIQEQGFLNIFRQDASLAVRLPVAERDFEPSPTGRLIRVGKEIWTNEGKLVSGAVNCSSTHFGPSDQFVVTENNNRLNFWKIEDSVLKLQSTQDFGSEIGESEYSRTGDRFAVTSSAVVSSTSVFDSQGKKICETVPLRNTAYYKTLGFCSDNSRLIVQTCGRHVQFVEKEPVNFPVPGHLPIYSEIKSPLIMHATHTCGSALDSSECEMSYADRTGVVVTDDIEEDFGVWDEYGNRIGRAAIPSVEDDWNKGMWRFGRIKVDFHGARVAVIGDFVIEYDSLDNGIGVLDYEPLGTLEADAVKEACSRDPGLEDKEFSKLKLIQHDNQVLIEDNSTREMLATIKTSVIDAAAALMPAANRLLIGDGKTVRIIELTTFRELARIPQTSSVSAIETSQDGRCAIVKYANGSGRIWDVRPLEEKRSFWKQCSAEFEPSKAYVKDLMATRIPTADLMNTVLDDSKLTARRRWGIARLLIEEIEINDALAAESFDKLKQEFPFQKEVIRQKIAEIRKQDNAWRKWVSVDERFNAWQFTLEDIVEYCIKTLSDGDQPPTEYEKAHAASLVAFQLSTTDPDVLLVRGAAEFRLKRYEQARQLLEQSLANSNADTEYALTRSLFLAMVKYQLGDIAGARSMLASVVMPTKPEWSMERLFEEAQAMIGKEP